MSDESTAYKSGYAAGKGYADHIESAAAKVQEDYAELTLKYDALFQDYTAMAFRLADVKHERDEARRWAKVWKRSAKVWRKFAKATVKNHIGKLPFGTSYLTARQDSTIPPF